MIKIASLIYLVLLPVSLFSQIDTDNKIELNRLRKQKTDRKIPSETSNSMEKGGTSFVVVGHVRSFLANGKIINLTEAKVYVKETDKTCYTNEQGVCTLLLLKKGRAYKMCGTKEGYEQDCNDEVSEHKHNKTITLTVQPIPSLKNQFNQIIEYINSDNKNKALELLNELERDYRNNEHIKYYKSLIEE